jgi:hypothetical protein
LRTLRSITLTATLQSCLSGAPFRHGVACAVCAEWLARRHNLLEEEQKEETSRIRDARRGPIAPDEAFVAGLLHDVGKMALEACAPRDALARVGDQARTENVPLYMAEASILGVDHARAGAALAEKWNLPAPLVSALRWHHDPLQAPHGHVGLTAITHVANLLCRLVPMPGEAGGASGSADLVPPSPWRAEALALLGLPPIAEMGPLVREAAEALTRAAPLFKVVGGGPAIRSASSRNRGVYDR